MFQKIRNIVNAEQSMNLFTKDINAFNKHYNVIHDYAHARSTINSANEFYGNFNKFVILIEFCIYEYIIKGNYLK